MCFGTWTAIIRAQAPDINILKIIKKWFKKNAKSALKNYMLIGTYLLNVGIMHIVL
jgi:hypothetical protein